MARKSIPVALIAVILVIALALMGVAYGLWSETLTIHGTVRTGKVDAALSLKGTFDNESPEKDTGTCEALLRADFNLLAIRVGGAYPSYECNVVFDVHNAGTIPIHVHEPLIEVPKEAIEYKLVECYKPDVQLHTGEEAWCTLWIHVLQEAKQGGEYNFTVEIFAHQYNEEPD